MPLYKVSQIYEFQTSGWQEVYYCTAGSPAAAAGMTDDNQTKMLRFRAAGTVLKAIRAVEVYNPRVGVLNTINYRRGTIGAPTDPEQSQGATDISASAIYCRLGAAAGPSRPIFFRGIQDKLSTRHLDGTPDLGAITADMNRVLTVIQSGSPYQILSRRPGSFANAAPKKIVSVTQAAAGKVNLTLAADDWAAWNLGINLAFNGGTQAKVIVSGGARDSHNFPGLKGIFTVLGAVSPHIIISYDLPFRILGAQTPESLTVRNLWYEVNNITQLTPIDFRSRDTGRPTNLRRGRSRKVMSRH